MKASDSEFRKQRQKVLVRDNYTCHYCGEDADTVDHRVPRSRYLPWFGIGNVHHPWNLVACCRSCNSSKQDRTEFEFIKLQQERERKPFNLFYVDVDGAWEEVVWVPKAILQWFSSSPRR
jgi:5-methylcytosine-specific restriction endonuclease McrA